MLRPAVQWSPGTKVTQQGENRAAAISQDSFLHFIGRLMGLSPEKASPTTESACHAGGSFRNGERGHRKTKMKEGIDRGDKRRHRSKVLMHQEPAAPRLAARGPFLVGFCRSQPWRRHQCGRALPTALPPGPFVGVGGEERPGQRGRAFSV